MPLDAVFKVASMTKLVTTVATLQQVDDGLLDLDTPVAEIVPLFAELAVLDGFDGDEPRLRPQTGRPTVRQLLSHTSGLGYAAWHPDLNRYHQLTGARELGSARRAAFAEAPLVADPGTEFNYSSGLDWAGLVVEELSGQPLDRYWRGRIFDPLQMDDTLVLLDDAHRAVSVPVHLRGEDGAWGPTEIDLYQPGDPPPEFFAGGHCLYSTAADYTRLQRAILRGGELDGFRVLQPATLEELFRDQLGGIRVPVFPAAQPFATAEVDLGPRSSWTAGLWLTPDGHEGGRSPGSAGWLGLFNSEFWIDRTCGLTAGCYVQTLPFFEPAVVAALREFERAVYR